MRLFLVEPEMLMGPRALPQVWYSFRPGEGAWGPFRSPVDAIEHRRLFTLGLVVEARGLVQRRNGPPRG